MKIAVQNDLSNIKDFLKEKGFEVVDYDANKSDVDLFDAIVLTGQSDNMLGIEDVQTNATVIEASGLTPQEIYNQIQHVY